MAELEVVVAAIRDNIDYEKAFGEHADLRGRGDERMAFCVFHDNTETPALSINVEEGVYHCKNPECGAKGDVFTFLMRVRSQTFLEVVHELARQTNVAHLLTQEPPTVVAQPASNGVGGYVPPADGLSLADLKALAPASANGNGALVRTTPKKDKAAKQEMPPIAEAVVEKYHAALMAMPHRLAFLRERRGLTDETIIKFQIGHDTARYMIPVRDHDGLVRNVRRYLPEAKEAKQKMYSWREGYGSARLFPLDMLDETQEPMFIFEGELDCILARQLGLNAYSATGGAGTWTSSFNDCFQGKSVVVCYDNDKAGHDGARKVARALKDIAREIKVVKIPLAEPKGADLTDYIVGHGMTVQDFLELVAHATVWYTDGSEEPDDFGGEPTAVHLSEASEAQYFNQPLTFSAMVSGKTTAPFIVPEEVRVGCSPEVRGTMPMCERCAVNINNGPVTKTFDFKDNDVLKMVNVNEAALARAVKAMAGVPTKCMVSSYTPLKSTNIESVQLIPEIAFSDKETPYVTRMAYYIGHGLQANRSYTMRAITVPEPSKQLATHLITTATPAQSNIDAFSLSDDVVSRLKAFRPVHPDVKGLWTHLEHVYGDLEKVTKIYERRDLMLAVDLVYHSALSFAFQGDLLQRGWTEALIIGDSRTGKSTVVQRLMNHYRAGEMTSAENTSAVGLIGGLHQIGTTWVLQWGRIPLNDRRALIIDEISGLTTQQIGQMSSMRSSGVAEIVRIHTEKTSARTRLIMIGNSRFDRTMGSYSHGALAVKELIGAPADIARFDIVATAATNDVALATVNAPREPESPTTFTSELCHQRVMWAWSRTSDQICWADGAEAEVLRIATEHGQKYRYATEIPLVEPNEQRVKLARLAVATAITFFSASGDGQQVIVQTEHVQFAAEYLERLYAKPSLAFDDYADQQRRMYAINGPEKVEAILKRNALAPQMLMEQSMMTQKDLQEILAYDDLKETRIAITALREASFLKRYGTSGYVKTPAAITMLRQIMLGHALSEYVVVGNVPSPSDPDDQPSW